MSLPDLSKLTLGLSRTWAGLLRDWDRCLRAGNYPETTRYNYLLAAAQLAWYLAEYSPDPDADTAADDPAEVTRAHVEAFQAWMIETRSPSTAVNKHKGLQQFFKWLLLDEQLIDRSPMDRVRQPKTPVKLVPVMREEDTGRLLAACQGKGFVNLRDEALIRLYCNTGARLSEVGNLLVADVDLNSESVHYRGKGAKDRRVRFGPKTARAVSRYLPGAGPVKGRAAAEPVAGRARLPTLDSERHQDQAQAAGRRGRRAGRARSPVAAQLRPPVEARRRRHRRSDAPARVDLRRHAPPLRSQRRGRTRPAHPGPARHR